MYVFKITSFNFNNLNVDENELKLEIKHGNKDAEVTIDKNGVSID